MKEGKKVLLKGLAASPGVVTGKVRIINSPFEIEKMKNGEILVAPETNPQYVTAILKAVAIITDRGGMLSHAAMVSRELGIPGVVGTLEATRILKDGMEVIVDGSEDRKFISLGEEI